MKFFTLSRVLLVVLLFSAATDLTIAQTIAESNVRAQMEFLASDAMQGRGSGTRDEWLAAAYIGSQLRQFGVEPAGERDVSGAQTFLQTVSITRQSFSGKLNFAYGTSAAKANLESGKEFIVSRLNQAQISGALQKASAPDVKPNLGAAVLVKFGENETGSNIVRQAQKMLDSGAAIVIVEENAPLREAWETLAARNVSFTSISGTSDKKTNPSAIVFISKDAATRLRQAPDATPIEINGTLADPQIRQTWNAVGKISGADGRLGSEVILLSAHLDHLGVRQNAPGADKIYNGADDDASGCVAVLELARALAGGKKPKRTVYFAFFGSEEMGGYGAQYYVNNLPFPKEKFIANLEFEMIGRPDAKVKPEELWLTGYDRSNLGAELARRGAKLVNDPHPEENFFQRSDNYTLARQGIIAHTVSSFGLHKDYHQASDEVKTIDFVHMTRAINSMIKPVQWLVNSDFKPVWLEGKKP